MIECIILLVSFKDKARFLRLLRIDFRVKRNSTEALKLNTKTETELMR